MLSLSIIFSLLVLLFLLKRWLKGRWVIVLQVILFNLLIVEGFCYLYFLKQIGNGNSFFLIGNQSGLDKAIVQRFVEFAYVDTNHVYSIYRTDPELGYTVAENKFIGNFKATNSSGMRSDREYFFVPDNTTFRMMTLGDSFVFCDGELTQNTWPYFLQNAIKKFEVLNLGVSGYGLGQSYLRFLEDGLRYHPDLVFINYSQMTGRDMISYQDILGGRSLRNSDVFRVYFWIDHGTLMSRALSPLDLISPVFRQQHIYEPVGIKENEGFWSAKIFSYSNVGLFLKQIFWPKYVRKHMVLPEEFNNEDVHLKILSNLLTTAKKNNITVLFLAVDFDSLPKSTQQILSLYKENVVYIDQPFWGGMFGARAEHYGIERPKLFNETNHYSAVGNKVFAETLLTVLASRTWGKGNRVFAFDPETKAFVNVSQKKPLAKK